MYAVMENEIVLEAIKNGPITAGSPSYPNLLDRILLSMNDMGALPLIGSSLEDGPADKASIPIYILLSLAVAAKIRFKSIRKWTTGLPEPPKSFIMLLKIFLLTTSTGDGSDYHRGKIPLLARIVAMANPCEVVKNGRQYKEPMNREEIKQELKKMCGKSVLSGTCGYLFINFRRVLMFLHL